MKDLNQLKMERIQKSLEEYNFEIKFKSEIWVVVQDIYGNVDGSKRVETNATQVLTTPFGVKSVGFYPGGGATIVVRENRGVADEYVQCRLINVPADAFEIIDPKDKDKDEQPTE